MRSILERAIECFLNEETEKAETLVHKFMVERARQIHEAISQGDDVLCDGWDADLVSEDYLSDADLADAADGDETPDEVTTEVTDEDGAENSEDDATALQNFVAELERLTADFKDELAGMDDAGEDSTELSIDTTDEPEKENSDNESDEVDEADAWENFDLDDITESIIADLETVKIDRTKDGQMTNGKDIEQNKKSPLTQEDFKDRKNNDPALMSKQDKYDSFDRQTAPASKQFGRGPLNSYTKISQLEKPVKKGGDDKAALNTNFAGNEPKSFSPIAGKK